MQKLIGIGLPRTGTTSLCEALEVLGYRTLHFPFEFWESGDFSPLERCDLVCDTPVFQLYPQIESLWGSCRFIHTTRPLAAWLKSMEWLLAEGPKIWSWRVEYDLFNAQFFGSARFDRDLYTAAYHRHHEQVREFFAGRPEDLLTVDLGQSKGWDPFCSFLNLPVPSVPFPCSNPTRAATLGQRLSVRLHHISPQAARWVNGVRRRLSHGKS